MTTPDTTNPSWPQGRWIVTYIPEKDNYEIVTEYGERVAYIASTLVAYWITRTHNSVREEETKHV